MDSKDLRIDYNYAPVKETFDFRTFFRDEFMESMFRAKHIRDELWKQSKKAVEVSDKILNLELTEENIGYIQKQANKILDDFAPRESLPDIQLMKVKVDETLAKSTGETLRMTEPVRVSKEEMEQFVKNAITAEKEISEFKDMAVELLPEKTAEEIMSANPDPVFIPKIDMINSK